MIFASKREHSFKHTLLLAVGFVLVLHVAPCIAKTTPSRIEVRGNRSLSNDRVKAIVTRSSADGAEAVARDVQDAYIQMGYLFAEIRMQNSEGGILLVIDEGEAARFGDVTIDGVEHFTPAEVLAMLGAREGDRYEPRRLQRSVNELLGEYDRDGFPFAQVWIDNVRLDDERALVGMNVHIVEGGSKRLERVTVHGLEKTREDLAVRLSGLDVGEPYDGGKVRDAYLRLSASGLFEDVSYPSIRLAPDATGVEALIEVIEPTQSNRFTAALGYADREATQDAVISGVVEFDLVNIGGSLRDLSAFWRNDGAGRSETRLQFRQRFFLGQRFSLGLRLEQVGIDTLSTWQSLGLESEVPVGRIGEGLFGLDFGAYADRNTFGVGDVAQSIRLRFQGGFSYKAGRSVRGTFVDLHNRGTFARKRVDGRDEAPSSTIFQYILDAGLRTGTNIAHNLLLTHELRLQTLESDEVLVPLSEQFYIGGAATLRGYRENQFHGRRVAYSRNELGLGRSRRENGYAFVDFGYVLQEALQEDGAVASSDLFRVGYGFGVRTRSRAGNIDISFGIGEELSLQQTKIHVILNRSF